MDIDDLKSNWKNLGNESFSEKQLQMMTKVNNHPTLKKLRLKLIIEAGFLTTLLFVYYDGFDGHTKPFWSNSLLIICVLFYITNNVFGYFQIKNPIQGNNILNSVQNQIKTIKRLTLFSAVCAILYAITLLVFFSVSIEFTPSKYMMLVGLIITFAVMFYFSFKSWKKRAGHFNKLLNEFEDI